MIVGLRETSKEFRFNCSYLYAFFAHCGAIVCYNFDNRGGMQTPSGGMDMFKNLAIGLAAAASAAVAQAAGLPAGYSYLEYIESTGSQYINTGYYAGPSTVFDAEIQLVGARQNTTGGYLMQANEGDAKDATKYSFTCNFGADSSSYNNLHGWFYMRYQHGWNTVENMNVGSVINNRVHFSFDSTTGKFSYGSVSRTCAKPTHQFTECPLYILTARHPDTKVFTPFNYFKMRIYSWKFFDGTEPARNFIPCKNGEGEAGLYDLVGGVFYPSIGSAPFEAGPEIVPPTVVVSASVDGLHGGSVSVVLNGEDVNGTPIDKNAIVALTAIPDAGFRFVRWSLSENYAADRTEPVLNLALDKGGDVAATALFRRTDWQGEVPSGYTRLEYVKTTREQCFDTGFLPCPGTAFNASVAMEGQYRNANNAIFGAMEGTFAFYANFGNNTPDQINAWLGRAYGAGAPARQEIGASEFNDGGRFALCVNSRRQTLCYGSVTVEEIDPTVHCFATNSFVIAGRSNNGVLEPFKAFDMRIYSWRIEVDDEVVRDYLPCRRDADDAVGLYDTVLECFVEPTGGAVVAGGEWNGVPWSPKTVMHMPGHDGTGRTDFTPSLSSMTASAWVRNARPGTFTDEGSGMYRYGAIMAQGALGTDPGFCCFMTTNTANAAEGIKLKFQTRNLAKATHSIEVDWSEEAGDDTWHMVTISFDRETMTKRLYIDGKLRAEASGASVVKPTTRSAPPSSRTAPAATSSATRWTATSPRRPFGTEPFLSRK